MSTSASAESNCLLAENIIDRRHANNTKKQYDAKVKQFVVWIASAHPEILSTEDSTELDYSLVTNAILKEFFAHISKKRDRSTGEYLDPIQFQSFALVSGYKSALKNHFQKTNNPFSKTVDDEIKSFLAGYERLIANLKKDGDIPLTEGKIPLSFGGYSFLAERALAPQKSVDSTVAEFELSIFAHVFLLLCWNVMARCVSISSLLFDNISWIEDAMTIVFAMTKSDQEGKNCSPKHVFANPLHPEICPILSLGIYIFTLGFRRHGGKRSVFGGENDVEVRFGNWLRKVCGENDVELLTMGMIITDIGTHSFRKGIANFLAGMPGGPSPVSIYLRAGWSLGPVQKRYIMEGQGGDQLCGRAATGLSLSSREFGSLPPHFDIRSGEILTEQQWQDILPGYSTFYPISFRPTIVHLLASLVFHQPYLERTLAASHPLKLTRLWTSGVLISLRDKVESGVVYNPKTNLSATGIPPHILVLDEINRVQRKQDELDAKVDKIPELVRDRLLEAIQINGAMPITREYVDGMFSTIREELRNLSDISTRPQVSQALDTVVPSLASQTWTWNGRLHPVPQTFTFPRGKVKIIWDLWWTGNQQERIGPYKSLKAYDLSCAAEKTLLSKARTVINRIVSCANLEDGDSRLSAMSISERDATFQNGYIALLRTVIDGFTEADFDNARMGDLSYCRLYDLIKRTEFN